MLPLSHCITYPEPRMASEMKRKRKPKPQPLVRSMHLIEDERKNVARRTRERISLLCLDLEEEHEYGVDKATQTEIAMRQVHVEIENWHTCLNAFCFCLLLLCMNLLYFQWLNTSTTLQRA